MLVEACSNAAPSSSCSMKRSASSRSLCSFTSVSSGKLCPTQHGQLVSGQHTAGSDVLGKASTPMPMTPKGLGTVNNASPWALT